MQFRRVNHSYQSLFWFFSVFCILQRGLKLFWANVNHWLWFITLFSFVHHILCFEGCSMQFPGAFRQCACKKISVDHWTYYLDEVSFLFRKWVFKPENCFCVLFLICGQMKENHPKPKPNKRLLEKMIQNRARKQQQDRAGEDGRRPGEPILFNVGQRCFFVVLVIFLRGRWWAVAKEEKNQFFPTPDIVAFTLMAS